MNSPPVVHSDPIEEPFRPDSAFATGNTIPRERVSKRGNKNPRTRAREQRPTTFDRNYFRRFNEEQARLQSGGGSMDVDMSEDSSSESSSSGEEQ